MTYKFNRQDWAFGSVFVIEVESHFRTLNINDEWYYLNLPKMQFFVTSKKSGNSYSYDAFVNTAHVIIPINEHEFVNCPLPNSRKTGPYSEYLTGKICFGEDGLCFYGNEDVFVKSFLKHYYTSAFVNLNEPTYDGPESIFFDTWQRTKAMPELGYLTMNLKEFKKKLLREFHVV
jgi:hypothetical protein